MKLNNKNFISISKFDQIRFRKHRTKLANQRRHKLRLKQIRERSYQKFLQLEQDQQLLRRSIFKSIRARFKFHKAKKDVVINGEFGIENDFDDFLDKAEALVDFNAKELVIFFENCTRVWPSAVTLLCSLKQWVELVRSKGKKPSISSTKPSVEDVFVYLYHCGFTEYVRVDMGTPAVHYNSNEIVKIRREHNEKGFDDRLDELDLLLKSYTSYSPDEIEEFEDVVLQEIFSNITEHGLSFVDRGWWMLAQYHKHHGLISLCMADNGIGFRNTLMSGPQRNELEKRLPNISMSDGGFIELAINEHVSGALEAPERTRGGFLMQKRYRKGEKRGRGLELIKNLCVKMGIKLTILSQHGFYSVDNTTNRVHCGSRKNRVMAGTMYHLTIPAKGIADV